MNPLAPWLDVTFAGVYWQEEERLPTLLAKVRPWFANIVVGVQKGEDATLEIARNLADRVVEDAHHGVAEPTFSKVLQAISTPWTFVVSGDEMPSDDLLDSFQAMLDMASSKPHHPVDGFWIHFRSTIDGIDFTAEQDGHTRVFKTALGWPTTMHSSPSPTHVEVWNTGFISHDRSLDEMIQDYLRYYHKGIGNSGWVNHNRMMMREACKGVAERKGWKYVKAYPWWSEVESIAFSKEA